MSIAHHDGDEKKVGVSGGGNDDSHPSIDAPPSNYATSPLDFLYGEHLRQRQLAKVLTLIADGLINRKTIASVIAFMENDLALHIMDEELALFPVLRSVCKTEDKIDAILDILAKEHREDEAESDEIVAILKDMAAGNAASERSSERLRDFADRLRHHLALENGVLLPIARMRMTADALRSVGDSIAVRRKDRKK